MDLSPLQHASRRDDVDAERWRQMRAPLERRIALTARPAARRPVQRPILSHGLIGVGAAVAALVAALVIAPAAPQSAGAAELLSRAASATTATGGGVLSLRQRTLVPIGGWAEAPSEFFWERQQEVLRVPAGKGRWIRKRWHADRSYAFGDPGTVRRDLRDEDASDASSSGWTAQRPMIDTSVDGVFVNDPAPRAEAPFGEYPEQLRALPRDPQRLLQALEAGSRDSVFAGGPVTGPTTGDDVLRTAYGVLTSGAADAGLQRAVFEALQRVPGLEIVDRGATDLDGRVGVAIGVAGAAAPGERRELLVIDPASGRLLGARSVLRSAWGAAPAGTPVEASSVDSGLADDCCGAWTPGPGRTAFAYR